MMDNYLAESEEIILSIFNQKPIGEQPQCLSFFEESEEISQEIFKFIKEKTERGKFFNKYPLLVRNYSKENIQNISKEKTLFISFNAQDKTYLKDLRSLSKPFGILFLTKDVNSDHLILDLAEIGFFPKVQFQHPTHYFEVRSYTIRHPKLEDLSQLIQLEKQCWAPHLQETTEGLLRRIKLHAQDSLVMEEEGKLLGVNYAQRLPSIDLLKYGQWKTLADLPTQEGSVIRLVSLNVAPTHWFKGYGDQLLEFLLYWRSLQENVSVVAAATRCSEYYKHLDKTLEEYIFMTEERGLPVDPILRFHVQHGAKVMGLIPHFRPEDKENQGNGVFIEYPIKKLELKTQRSEKIAAIQSREDIKQVVEANIQKVLGDERFENYSLFTPFMDMGFDSLSLLELRSLLAARFDTEIPATFFFQYGTAEKTIRYFEETILESYKDWLYNVEWVELPIPLFKFTQEKRGTWLIFGDEGETTTQLIQKMGFYGYPFVVVKNGAYFYSDEEANFTVRYDSLDDFEKLFKAPFAANGIQGIIYLWGLFKKLPSEPSLDSLRALHRYSCLGLINLVKSVNNLLLPYSPKFFVGTWSVQEEGDSMALAEWPLTGLCKAVNTERPDFQLHRISLDPNENSNLSADYFFLELSAKDKEDQVLWKGGKRYGPRLIRVELPNLPTKQFDENGTYLLVGGIGLSLRVIDWYKAKGAKNFVVICQNKIPQAAKDIVLAPDEEIFVDLHEEIDIGNYDLLKKILSNVKKPLKGVMFFPTKIEDELIIHNEWSSFENILNLKVAGSWNIHLLTKEMPLDHFILFAGIGPTLDTRWKANRAMGNAFLDALAHYRKAKNLPALTIDWGPWSNQGLIIHDVEEEHIPFGIRFLTADECLNVIDHIMDISLPEVVAAPCNWQEFFLHYKAERPLLINMKREVGLKNSEIITRFQKGREEEREEILRQYVRMHIRRALLLRSTASLENDKPFNEMGFTLAKLQDLKNNMQLDLGDQISLPYNLIRETSSITEVSQTLYPLLTNTKSETVVQENEPLAIIGMGCRFPNNVNSPEQFYQFLMSGTDAVTSVPQERWIVDPQRKETSFGSFLKDIDLFDPHFFGISPREAKYLDPQARILLEVCWEALENGGIPPETLKETATGVFIGISTDDYTHLLRESGDHSAYVGTGNFASAVVGRVSHTLGLQGPNMAIDTACSSSLVAIHEACTSLQQKESDLAIAGGVQLNLLPDWHWNFAEAHMLSPDGHCKTFDASANGYVRGEGCGVVVLKRLSDAIQDGDAILAVIRGTAINQDGRSTGFTVPNGQAQIALIKKALQKAQIGSQEIDYIEAHGTGTALGDPIEVAAIGATYGKGRQSPLLMGSVKSNIGHLEAAAGVAGLMKVVLSLQNEKIPQNLHFDQLNPKIESNFPFKIVSENATWSKNSKGRFGAVSAFGFSGTNAHAIVEEAPKIHEAHSKEKSQYLVTLSAKTENALKELIKKNYDFIKARPDLSLASIAYTSHIGRSHFNHRMAVIAHDLPELLKKFEQEDYLSGYSETHVSEKVESDPDLATLALHYVQGADIDWKEFEKLSRRAKIRMPTYPFQRNRYWIESSIKRGKEIDSKPLSQILEVYWKEKSSQTLDAKLSGKWMIISQQRPSFVEQIEAADLFDFDNVPHNYSYKGIIVNCNTFEKAYRTLLSLVPYGGIESLILISQGKLDQSPLNGLLRVIANEYPHLKCKIIQTQDGNIVQEIQQPDREIFVKLEKGARYVQRLKNLTSFGSPTIRPEGTYLITGGLGNLGRMCADHLIALGAKNIDLVSRREVDSKVSQWIQQNGEKGIKIHHHRLDIGDEGEIIKLLFHLKSNLMGIIHLAGVLDDAILRNQSWERLENVFKAKAKGAWNLHNVSQQLQISLDFFVLFSSISSILGTAGQANYAAANAYLDALASERKSKGLPALSIHWGGWKEGGMALGKGLENLEHQFPGVGTLTNVQGLDALSKALSLTLPEVFIAPLVVENLPKLSKNLWPLFEDFLPQETLQPEKKSNLKEKLHQAPEKSKRIIQDYLYEQLCHVLQMEKNTPIDRNEGFFAIGMDSLLALEFKNNIQQDFEQILPETLAFDFPTLSTLEGYVEKLLGLKEQKQVVAIQKTFEEEPIAIIGMSCRFPGHSDSPEKFWELLIKGTDGITEVPADRWDNEEYFSENPEEPGKIATRMGGFVDKIEMFDADFFGMNPREASVLDPQQRLALETTWEALERAGIAPNSLMGSLTGVFMGVSFTDYLTRLAKNPKEDINAYLASGNVLSGVTGRISYTFGLQGPCIAMDTACSSSLVALNEACQHLRLKDCDLAISGGVNILLSPEIMITLSRAHMLAPDGHCKTFDAKADGYVRSEGCGILILKRLQDAIRDKDNILALIRGSAVMQDGKTGGLTVPNGQAQEQVIQHALQNAQVMPQEIQFLEAHGTGTSLGDPIEVQSIANVFGHNRKNPLILGAVKSNIGHLESAAGIAGVIKTVLAMNHEMIPPNRNFEAVNPKIHLETIPAEVASKPIPWNRNEEPRIAGISSFGFTGTIAHAILEEAPLPQTSENQNDRPLHLLTLSAKTAEALKELADKYLRYFEEHPHESLADIAYTANTSRVHFPYRLTWIGETAGQIRNQPYTIQEIPFKTPKIAFIYSNAPQQNAQIDLWKAWGIIPDFVGKKEEMEMLRAQGCELFFDIEESTWQTMLENLAKLYLQGFNPDWKAFDAPYSRKKVVLPTYPFQRKRFWSELTPPAPIEKSTRPYLLMRKIDLPVFKGSVFETDIHSEKYPDFIADHVLYGARVIAGVVYLATVMTAAKILFQQEVFEFENIQFMNPLIVQKGEIRQMITTLYPAENGIIRFEIQSRPRDESDQDWTLHVVGFMKEKGNIQLPELKESLDLISERCNTKEFTGEEFYNSNLVNLDFEFGPRFKFLETIRLGKEEILGKLRAVTAEEEPGYVIYPGLLDASIHTMETLILSQEKIDKTLGIGVPFSIKQFLYDGRLGDPVWTYAKYRKEKQDTHFHIDYYMINKDGKIVGHFNEFVGFRAPMEPFLRNLNAENKVIDWFYEIVPTAKPLLTEKKVLEGTWMIIPDSSGFADQLAQQLQKKGVKTEISSIEQLQTNSSYGGILFLSSSHADKTECLLHLLQKLVQIPKIPLWIITDNTLEQAPLEGLRKIALLEHPDLQCRRIEMDELNAERVIQELEQTEQEEQIIYQGGERTTPRLMRIKKFKTEPVTFDPTASYLITGGLGGLGLTIAQWLVEQGVKHLILVGRTSPTKQPILEKIQSQAHVEVVNLDIAERLSVEGLIQEFGKKWPELKGIFHAAGVLDDGALISQDWSRFEKVFAPKVLGGWNLHQATLSKKLDHFVLFSSIASVVGSLGQSNYAAANAFLDKLAAYRKQKGLAGLSISWGPWGEVGMAAKLADKQQAFGYIPMKPSEAVVAFKVALQQSQAHLLVANVDWKKLFEKIPSDIPLINGFKKIQKTATETSSILDNLKTALPIQRNEVLRKYLRQTVGKVIGLSDETTLNDDQGFFNLGIDSILSIDLKNKVQSDIGTIHQLPATLAFDHPSISSLAEYFETHVFPALGIETEVIQELNNEKELEEKLEQEKLQKAHIKEDDIAQKLKEKYQKSKKG